MTPEKKLPCTAKLLLPSALLSEILLNTFPNGVQMSIFSSRFRLIVDLEVASGTWSSALSSPRTVESALWETYVLFRPAQTTMPSRPLKKEIRTRKFLKGASIYKQVYANKADIVSIGEYAEVRQANHTATETHETSRKCITSEIKAHLFLMNLFFDVLGITSKDLPTMSLSHVVCDMS